MRYRPKEAQYPQSIAEYHVVTPSGVTVMISDDYIKAEQRLRNCPVGYKIIRVSIVKEDVTGYRGSSKSSIMRDIAASRGVPLVDTPVVTGV